MTNQDRKTDTQDTPRKRKTHAESTEPSVSTQNNASVSVDSPMSPETNESSVSTFPEPSPLYLKKAQEVLEIAQSLAAGRSVRQTVSELGFSKSLVEDVSKGLSRDKPETSGSPRQAYLNRPYEVLMEQQQKTDRQRFLSDKIKDMVEDALMLSLQVGVYRDILGMGKRDGEQKPQSQGLDINAIVQASIAKDLLKSDSFDETVEKIAKYKEAGLLGQTDNFMERYAAMEQLKDSAVEKHSALQAQAFQQAKAQNDRSLVETVVKKGVEAAEKLLAPKAVPSLPPLPQPLEINSLPQMPNVEPDAQAVVVPEPQPQIIRSVTPLEDPSIGYTILTDPHRRRPS